MAGRPQKQQPKQQSASTVADAPSRADEDRYTASDVPLFEWLVGAAGLALVTAVIVYMLYESVTGRQSPPDVKVSVTSIVPVQNGYLVNVEALNQGGSTAARVVLEGELRKESQILERSHVTLDYSPPHSAKRAGLFFTRDPRQWELQVRALGFEEP